MSNVVTKFTLCSEAENASDFADLGHSVIPMCRGGCSALQALLSLESPRQNLCCLTCVPVTFQVGAQQCQQAQSVHGEGPTGTWVRAELTEVCALVRHIPEHQECGDLFVLQDHWCGCRWAHWALLPTCKAGVLLAAEDAWGYCS